MSPGIAISIMAQLLSFLFTTTISGFLALISLSHWIITSHKTFTSSFSTTPSGACSYHFSLLFELYLRHNFQLTILFLQHYLAFSCTHFVPTFHIRSQYEILLHFSCHLFYKVVIALLHQSSVSNSLFEFPALARYATWLPFQLSGLLFSASSMFLFYPLFLAFILQTVHTFFCFFIVLFFPHPTQLAFLLIHFIVIFYCFCSFLSTPSINSSTEFVT